MGEYHNADLRTVLNALFASAGMSYTMSDSIQGKVSLRLPPMLFDRALQQVLLSCYLTYRVEGGVFQIISRETSQDELDQIAAAPMPREEPNKFLDSLAPAVKANKTKASELFWKLMSAEGNYFVIGIGIDTPLTLDVSSKTNREVLHDLTKAGKATLREFRGVWSVAALPRVTPLVVAWPSRPSSRRGVLALK